jgi:CRP-like cAMP-binding protein
MALLPNSGNRLLAALPLGDFDLLAPYLQRISFGLDDVLVRTEEQFEHVYFPVSGVVAFLVEMSDGHTVASTLMGSEGAVGALSVLSSSRSPVTVTAYVAGSALRISSSNLKYAFEQSAAVEHVLRLHLGTQLLQLQNVAACNAVHPVECRMVAVVARTARSGCGRRNSADAGGACTAFGGATNHGDIDNEQASRSWLH